MNRYLLHTFTVSSLGVELLGCELSTVNCQLKTANPKGVA